MTGLIAQLTNVESIGLPVMMVGGGVSTAVVVTWFISTKISNLATSFDRSISKLREQIARELVEKEELRDLRVEVQETNRLAQSNREDVRVLMAARETNPGLTRASLGLGGRDE